MNGTGTMASPRTGLPPRYMPSGLGFYDARTGGLRAGKRYIFGAPRGADASIVALQVAVAGLRGGEVVLVVTAEDPEALVMQGERVGLPLARFLYGDQCILLAYDRQFGERAANPALAPGLVRDLQRKTNNRPLHRVVLLDEPVGGGTTGKTREALDLLDVHVREQHGAVVVHVGDPHGSSGDVRHAELQRTAFGACVVEPEAGPRGLYGRFRLLKDPALVGGSVSGQLAIRPGEGFYELEADAEAASVVYVGTEGRLPALLQDSLGAGFRVLAHDPGGALPLPADLPASSLIVVEVDPTAAEALALVERIRHLEPAAPLVAIARPAGRSADRVRLFRQGVDEVVDRETPLAEVRERLRRHAARLGFVPPVPPEFSSLEAGRALTGAGEAGPVPWGSFERSTTEMVEAMGREGGDFALFALSVRGDGQSAGGVAERVAAALALNLRREDPCAVSPDGVVVARLFRVGKADVEPMAARLAARLDGSPAFAGLETGWAAVVYPHDGRDFDGLYKRLVGLERQAARARRAQEPLTA